MSKIQGKTIVTTGSAESSLSLITQLAGFGAQVYTFPMIDVRLAPINQSISNAISTIETYDYLIFTSKYGVKMFFKTLFELTQSFQIPQKLQIACVGKQTASTLEQYGHTAQYISAKNNGKDFAQELIEFIVNRNSKILFPTGNLTQNMIALTVPNYIQIDKIIVYETNAPETYNPKIAEKIQQNQYDLIIFTSPSGVTNFSSLCGNIIDITSLKCISIGPTTTARLQEKGVTFIVQAKEYNAQGIVKAIEEWYR